MDERVARRYARALFQAAQHEGSIYQVSQDLARVDATIKSQEQLRHYLFSPLVARDTKAAALDRAFASLGSLTRRVLHLLIEKRREENLALVHSEFDRLREENAGLLRAIIQTARPLPADQRSALIAKIEKQTGKKLLVTDEIDPDLLGGVRVQIGDTMLDGAVRGELRRLRERFIHELARQV